jgi:hypothetical protein
LKSLAAVASPEQYAAIAMPFIKHDCYQGFSEKVYVSVLPVANKAQETCLMAEIGRQGIAIEPAKLRRRTEKGATQ